MIQKYTVLNIADNTGAKKAKCIHVYQGYRRRYAKIGDIIKIAIQNLRPLQSLKSLKNLKNGVLRAIILTTKKDIKSPSGYSCSFDVNNLALFKDKTNKLLSNRILIPSHKSFRKTKFLRVTTLSRGTIG